MRVTPDLLREIGFEQQKNNNDILIDTWYFKMHGYIFIMNGGPEFWELISPGNYYSHSVTHLGEMFGFIYDDAYDNGKEAFKKEFREFIGVK